MTIFVGNLNSSGPIQLRSLFEIFGKVRSVNMSKNYAYVRMECPNKAARAINELDTIKFNGRKLRVKKYHRRKTNTAFRSYTLGNVRLL